MVVLLPEYVKTRGNDVSKRRMRFHSSKQNVYSSSKDLECFNQAVVVGIRVLFSFSASLTFVCGYLLYVLLNYLGLLN